MKDIKEYNIIEDENMFFRMLKDQASIDRFQKEKFLLNEEYETKNILFILKH